MTIDFYDQNGQAFFDRTVNLDITEVWQPFLELVPAGGHILDAGCGSGRETKTFRDLGYRVTAFDASETMVRLASEYTGLPVLHLTFEQMDFESEFDGIWANASLLHVPLAGLPAVFEKFIRALKPGAVWYASFKWGTGEKLADDGRTFTNFDEDTFRTLAAQFPTLKIEQLWKSVDQRPEAKGSSWLNVILRRSDTNE
jgi:SAM-dependent methyltransferase